MKRKLIGGFTLGELIIVVIIVGILASIASPLYVKAVKKGKAAEAYAELGAIRGAMERYYLENGFAYTGATFDNLDIDHPNAFANRKFNYQLTVSSGSAYRVIAQYRTDANFWLRIDQDGNVVENGF